MSKLLSHQQPLKPFTQSNVRTERQLALPEGLRLCQYINDNEQVFYENQQQHTLSLYLEGGYQTFRRDAAGPHGAPGRFCLMPRESYSAWAVGSTQHFAHLYFDPQYLKRLAMRTFDTDPRLVELPQLTFAQDPALDALFRHGLLGWDWQAGNSLAIEQSIQGLLMYLLKQHGNNNLRLGGLTGGLAPQAKQLVIDYMQSHYTRQIRLQELAELVDLSEYHFCRMFKISLAQTPQQYLLRLRVTHAKQLIKQHSRSNRDKKNSPSLADIALDAGFANQSHMGRHFKQQLGLTPAQFARQTG